MKRRPEVNDVDAARIRRLYRELDALDPDEAARITREHLAATEAAYAKSKLRRWTCPLCWGSITSPTAPEGWLVCSPFDRVAACTACRPHFQGPPPR